MDSSTSTNTSDAAPQAHESDAGDHDSPIEVVTKESDDISLPEESDSESPKDSASEGSKLEEMVKLDDDSPKDDSQLEIEDEVVVPMPGYIEPLCIFFGATSFLSYTCCINAIDMFEMFFPGVLDLSANVSRITNFLSFAAMVINFPFIEKISSTARFVTGQALVSICFLFFMFYLNLSENVELYAIYIVMAIIGILFGILMGTSYGFCGTLTKNGGSLNAIGNAAAGIFSTILRLVSKAIGKGNIWFYFSIAFAMCFLSLILFLLFQRTEYCKYCKQFEKKGIDTCTRLKRVGIAFKKIHREFLEGMFCHWVTYTIFPGYATSTQIKHGIQKDWVTTAITSVYMICDFSGRMIARFWKWPSPKYVWINVVARLIFFPLFMISIEGLVIKDEIYIMVLSGILSFTGGYYMTCSMGYAAIHPQLEKDEYEIATYTASFGPGLGGTLGCLFSFAMPLH